MATAFRGLPWRLPSSSVGEGSPQEPPLFASCCVFLFCHHGNGDLSLPPPHW
jgi:hypothetical protein